MNSKTILISLLMMTTLAATTALAGVQVVAHADVADQALASQECQQVFLGKQSRWNDGTAIKLGIIGDGAAEFLKSHVKKSPSQYQTF